MSASAKWLIHRLQVAAEEAGSRLDQFVASQLAELSRVQVKKIIDLGGLHLNGRRWRNCATVVRSGDRIEVYIDQLSLEPYRLAAEDIVFRDPYLIVLNKPAGVDTQPTHARFKGTLYEALQWHLRDPSRPRQKPSIGMLQRLDRGTSGLMLFSLHPRAHKALSSMFREQQLTKRYLALVQGRLPALRGEICSSLARFRYSNRVASVARGGKTAVTRFRVRRHCPQASLVDIELLTGRSHQIRAHMAEQGTPLLGDERYQGPLLLDDQDFQRPLLHAAELAFAHPVTEEALHFSVAPPEDMNLAIEALCRDSIDEFPSD